MTPEFKATMTKEVEMFKEAGSDPVDVVRHVEKKCGQSNEEFDGHGKELVEEVYGGRFSPGLGGQGQRFFYADAPAEKVAETLPPLSEQLPPEPPKKAGRNFTKE